ncbi:MAG: hypothetical protein N2255_10555 [Kiritimatiellae bacterium]|nr:hypothetical protein [Kiritimatiellia bacterium]
MSESGGGKPETGQMMIPNGHPTAVQPVESKIGDLPTSGTRQINPMHYRHTFENGQAVVWVVPPMRATDKPNWEFGYMRGHFGLADLAHKESEIWFDFDAPAEGAALKARSLALKSPLHVLADGAWISRTESLTCGRFGTLEDEIETYKRWGWKGIDDPMRRSTAICNPVPEAFVSRILIHEESEADSAEAFVCMYVRTGQRGFLDLAQAYAGYYRAHGVWRTDGFVYDGWNHEDINVAKQSTRQSSALKHGWYGPKEAYGWVDSRFHACHQWACGLFDLYCLTGETDYLEAGLDWVEYIDFLFRLQKPGDQLNLSRKWGRTFGTILRAWQVTRDPKLREKSHHYAQVALKAPNRQPDGLFVEPAHHHARLDRGSGFISIQYLDELAPPSLRKDLADLGISWEKTRDGKIQMKDQKGNTWPLIAMTQTFEYQTCVEALGRWAEMTGDKEIANLVVGMASNMLKYAWSTKCEHVISHPYIGLFGPGTKYDPYVYDEEHKNCPGDNAGVHSSYYGMPLCDVALWGWQFSRNPWFLERAVHIWERVSKRGYRQTSQLAPKDEVYRFAGHNAPQGNRVDVRYCRRLFYEVPRSPTGQAR